ncbi:MAG: YceH family protein [Candidatus Latescibacterota bacterium]|nr:YceH family protein [Candidatus Latescibacterota bacterium]
MQEHSGRSAGALFNEVSERIVGALIEKSITTPDYYPMSLNALTSACNQKSNRHPVVAFDEKTVARTLDEVRELGLVRVVSGGDQRVSKYRHVFDEQLGFNAAETAVLCELMVRGAQTAGELRGRVSRMHAFDELAQMQQVLENLCNRPEPVVVRLSRQQGRKESRYAHLLAGAPETAGEEGATPGPSSPMAHLEDERLSRLEASHEQLRQEIADLRQQLETFRQQFE